MLRADRPLSTGPRLTDLLLGLDEVAAELPACVAAGDWLDAFLLAAAAVQIVEDHLQPSTAARRAGELLGGLAGRVAARTADNHDRLRLALNGGCRAWLPGAQSLRDDLADIVMAHGAPTEQSITTAVDGATGLVVAGVAGLPATARAELLRLPSAMRTFDLSPTDAALLARDLQSPDGDTPGDVVVVGVRTSGSYLGPLVAAELRRAGVRARAVTVRPGRPLLPGARTQLRAGVGRAGCVVAVVDDPPSTGSAYLKTCAVLHAAGVPDAAIRLLVPLCTDVVPAALTGMPTTTLPFDRWSVHARLEPAAVAAVLQRWWHQPVEHIRHCSDATPPTGRGHVTATYEVLTADGYRHVEVRGVGQGLFGRHAVAVADALGSAVPAVHGFEEGLLYSIAPASPHAQPVTGPADARRRAGYVATRAEALPARVDRARGLTGRAPAWEVAARRLGRGYGRLGDALRLPLIDPMVRKLCTTPHPSIVDGATGPEHWRTGPDGDLIKIDPDTADFGHTDRYSYDAAFDLAGIAPGHPDDTVVDALRAVLTCSDEAFLLYELVQLENPETGRPSDPMACSRAVRRYLSRTLPPPSTGQGPLCALDLDGVLDSTALGFPMTTPTGVRVLNALARHGYRPVPVTGRSLTEVQQRCDAHGLVGGVAEYGAVVHVAGTGATIDLLSAADRALLDEIRVGLGTDRRITVDHHHAHSVRVGFSPERASRPGPVPDEVLRELLGPDRHRGVRVVHGDRQTDIVAATTDKGRGLARLVAEVGGPVALAVGDTAEDIPFLVMAERALAPGNATDALATTGIRRTRRHYAQGVAEAAGQLLGHRPGGCHICREPTVADQDARMLLALLDASAGGRHGLPSTIWGAARSAFGTR